MSELNHRELELVALGVREKLRDALIGDGLDLRVYVPYGRDWRAYSVRRMRRAVDAG